MQKRTHLFLILLILIMSIKAENLTEKMVKDRVFTNSSYDKSIRPSEPVDIYLGLIFKQLANVDEKNQIITSSSYLIASWFDKRLTWNKSEVGINFLMIKANLLWLPDLYVINTADSNGIITVSDSNLSFLIYDKLAPCLMRQTQDVLVLDDCESFSSFVIR